MADGYLMSTPNTVIKIDILRKENEKFIVAANNRVCFADYDEKRNLYRIDDVFGVIDKVN